MTAIHYQRTHTYKYKVLRDYVHETGITGQGGRGAEAFVSLDHGGTLRIREGYRYDGPSGPTIDTPNFMRGALVHDALYQLMREGDLDLRFRKQADELMRTICVEDGMSRFRARYAYIALRMFGESSARPRKAYPMLSAPEGE